MPINVTLPLSSAATLATSGDSARHTVHQGAQNQKTTGLPDRDAASNAAPSTVLALKASASGVWDCAIVGVGAAATCPVVVVVGSAGSCCALDAPPHAARATAAPDSTAAVVQARAFVRSVVPPDGRIAWVTPQVGQTSPSIHGDGSARTTSPGRHRLRRWRGSRRGTSKLISVAQCATANNRPQANDGLGLVLQPAQGLYTPTSGRDGFYSSLPAKHE